MRQCIEISGEEKEEEKVGKYNLKCKEKEESPLERK